MELALCQLRLRVLKTGLAQEMQKKQFHILSKLLQSYEYQFATIAKSIHQLAEKERNFQWTEECEKSFLTIRKPCVVHQYLFFPLKVTHLWYILMPLGQGKGPYYLRFRMER